MKLPIRQIDAFSEALHREPAAVVLLSSHRARADAAHRRGEQPLRDSLRGPLARRRRIRAALVHAVEVELCGHATLAAAEALRLAGREGAASSPSPP